MGLVVLDSDKNNVLLLFDAMFYNALKDFFMTYASISCDLI